MKRAVGLFFYFTLSFLTVFFIAGWVVKLLGIGANQGLAAGAMVLFYAFIVGILGLVVAVLIYIKRKSLPLFKINLILLLLLALSVVLLKITPKKKSVPYNKPAEEVSQAGFFAFSGDVNKLSNSKNLEQEMGMGLYTPRMVPGQILYFYESPTLSSHNERLKPADSIVFEATTYGGFEMGYKPKWLEPHYVKLDYDMLLFQVNSFGRRYIELTVNESQNKILYVSADSGTYVDWNQFIIQAHSVEILDTFPQKIKSQPLIGSKSIFPEGDYLMVPEHIKGDWLLITITDLQYNFKGKGWIQWKKDGKLLIQYKMLS